VESNFVFHLASEPFDGVEFRIGRRQVHQADVVWYL
jgi:hypothetical protein